MGNKPAGASKTAKEVVDEFGTGKYLQGRTAIVTGGNSGVGLETCKALASAGCRVVLCSRSTEAGQKAVQKEVAQKGHGGYVVEDTSQIVVKELDLASLASIKRFADEYLSTETGDLNYLVLNAGIMCPPFLGHTRDGFEQQIGVNHFGHYYLTKLLNDKICNQAAQARVVSVASRAHRYGKLDPTNLHYREGGERKYNPWEAYGQSKLANILFAKSLAAQYAALPDFITGPDGARVPRRKPTAVSVHPGVVRTRLWRNTTANQGLLAFFADILFVNKTIPQGAATTVWACLSPEAGSEELRGAYLDNCAAVPTNNPLTESKDLADQLWATTEQQVAEAAQKLT